MNEPLTYLDFELTFKLSSVIRSKHEKEEENKNVYQIQITKTPVAATGAVAQLPVPKMNQTFVVFVRQRLEELRSQYQSDAYYTNLTVVTNLGEYQHDRNALAARLQRLGQTFYEVLPVEVQRAWETAYRFAQSQHKGLRFCLDLTEASQLYGLPWELLFDNSHSTHFALSTFTPIVRVVRTSTNINPHIEMVSLNNQPQRLLLVVIASNSGDEKYLVQELKEIRASLARLEARQMLEVDVLDGVVSFNRFRRQLLQHHYNFIHFIGHGYWDSSQEQAGLIFHNGFSPAQNSSYQLPIAEAIKLDTEKVGPNDLQMVMSDLVDLKLLFLNSCQAGRVNIQEEQTFTDIATSLTKNGIPAMISLQNAATQAAALLFASELYDRLTQGANLEAAVSESRKVIYLESRKNPEMLGQWFIPVFYRAVNLPEEKQPWFIQLTDNLNRFARQLSHDRTLMGSGFLLFVGFISVLLLQPLVGRLVPADPYWQAVFVKQAGLFSFMPNTTAGGAYWWSVLVPLIGWTNLIIFSIALGVHLDMRLDKTLWEVTGKQKLYLFGLNYAGATLGFLTGAFLSYVLLTPFFYYLGLADQWPTILQNILQILAVLPCIIMAFWFARQLPLSSKTSSPKFKPWDGETFIAIACFFLPALFFFLLLYGCSFIIFNRPWGGVFCLGVWAVACLWELGKLVRRANP